MFRHFYGGDMPVCALLDEADGILNDVVGADRGLDFSYSGGESVGDLPHKFVEVLCTL